MPYKKSLFIIRHLILAFRGNIGIIKGIKLGQDA
jgi:hypothetical protein